MTPQSIIDLQQENRSLLYRVEELERRFSKLLHILGEWERQLEGLPMETVYDRLDY